MTKPYVCFQVLKLVNLTTEVKMINIKNDELVEIVEYDQTHCTFEAESRSCQPGHLVQIQGSLHFVDRPIPFTASGKVEAAVAQPNGNLRITIKLRSCDNQLWNRFTSFLAKRQEEVDDLFEKMRDL